MSKKNNERRAVIIFAREPRWGKVKTRLAKDLPRSLVLELYKAFIKDVTSSLASVPDCARFIYYTGGCASTVSFLKKFSSTFMLRRQYGKSLGDRLHRAFVFSKRQGFKKTIIVGTDCLTLTARDIQQTFKKLEDFSGALGPSRDGGYYLIALREPQKNIFASIAWGSDRVLRQTLAAAKNAGLKFSLLSPKEDIDTLDTLKNFYKINRHRKQYASIKFLERAIFNG